MHIEEYKSDKRYDKSLWGMDYHFYRYLENLNIEDLEARYLAIQKNISMLAGGKMDALPCEEHTVSTWWWFRRLEQTEYEFYWRGKNPPPNRLQNIDYPCSQNIVSSNWPPQKYPFIIRYMKLKYAKEFLTQGVMRFSKSTKYLDDNNMARNDDENQFSALSNGKYIKFTNLTTGKDFTIIGDLKNTISSDDYYLASFCSDLDLRLFKEFEEYDAVIVITNVKKFEDRAYQYLESQKIISNMVVDNILYIDKNDRRTNSNFARKEKLNLNAQFVKDFSYAYQREIRFVINTLPEIAQEYQQIDVNIGNAQDIAHGFHLSNDVLIPIAP